MHEIRRECAPCLPPIDSRYCRRARHVIHRATIICVTCDAALALMILPSDSGWSAAFKYGRIITPPFAIVEIALINSIGVTAMPCPYAAVSKSTCGDFGSRAG